tara:strand:+ start:4767 stop:5237 length:471 start_codon:yes stop_codon:yes gene_type:complete
MIDKLIKQINHLGYKITQDPVNINTWKIACQSDPDVLYSLDFFDEKISLYRNEECICRVYKGEDPFLILRFLPSDTFLDNKIQKSLPIKSLFDFCNANSSRDRNIIIKILNSKNIRQFNSRRDFAYYVLECIKDAGFLDSNKNIDLSLIDIILNII